MFSYLPYSQPILNTVFPSSLQVSEGGVSHLFAIDIYFLLHHFTSKLFLTHRMQNTTAAEKMLILHISKTEKRYTENGHQLELSKVKYHVVDVASLCCMEGLDPSRFKSTERFHKTMRITDYFLRRKARENSSISAKEFRMRYEDVLGDCLCTIQHRLQKDLALPAQYPAMKPLLTQPMEVKRLAFYKYYAHCIGKLEE